MRNTMIPLVLALALTGASAASALPGHDANNNPWPSGSERVRHADRVVGFDVFAGPRMRTDFRAPRMRTSRAMVSSDWDRCIRRDEMTCVHN